MMEVLLFVIGGAVGFGSAFAAFVWMNRTQASRLDAAEKKMREWDMKQ